MYLLWPYKLNIPWKCPLDQVDSSLENYRTLAKLELDSFAAVLVSYETRMAEASTKNRRSNLAIMMDVVSYYTR